MSSKIDWQAADRIAEPHGPDWYWAVGIIALSLAVTSVILNNILFAVLVVLATIVLFLQTLQKPRLIHYELTNRGLWTDTEFESYALFQSFWVEDSEPASKLLITAKSIFTPMRVIPLQDVDPESVREFLQDYLPEVEAHEPLSKRIMEYLGF